MLVTDAVATTLTKLGAPRHAETPRSADIPEHWPIAARCCSTKVSYSLAVDRTPNGAASRLCRDHARAVSSGGVRISYDAVGEGRPLVLLHGWCGDRSWWTEPGYVDELRSDHRLVNVNIRGHGASDKPHKVAAYTARIPLTGDVFAVADAEGLDRFAIWGQSSDVIRLRRVRGPTAFHGPRLPAPRG
jgi:hypothetical protein